MAEVMMAEPEKAVVDSLDKMGYAGGIAGVARVIQTARQRVDLHKLADYALRMGSHALVQRLGYLLETLGDSLPPEVADRLLDGVGRSKTYLGPTGRWGTGGEYNAHWQVVVNVPAQQLLGEIRAIGAPGPPARDQSDHHRLPGRLWLPAESLDR
jgi:predicted transcriptional regulator of viral defense system